MSSTIHPSIPQLSICIATFNRQEALRSTLQAVVSQITNREGRDRCEIVVTDNASSDNTEQVVADVRRHFPELSYTKHDVNVGWERNFNSAIEAARGEYCWLMPDDDVLKPGAVTAVLDALRKNPSVVVINAEHIDADDNSITLLRRRLHFDADRVYGPDETDRFFDDVVWHLAYVGAVVIRRSIWLDRMREEDYGTWFPQIAVIFRSALPECAIALSKVAVGVSIGQQFWLSSASEICFYRWPSLIQSLAVSAAVKTRALERTRNLAFLVEMRAQGLYSSSDYRKWVHSQLQSPHKRLLAAGIAIVPRTLMNTLCVAYYLARHHFSRAEAALGALHVLRKSPYYLFGKSSRALSRP